MAVCYHGIQPKSFILNKTQAYTVLSIYPQQSGEQKVLCKNNLHSWSRIMGGTDFFIIAQKSIMVDSSGGAKNLSILAFFRRLWEVEFELDKIISLISQILTVGTIPEKSRTKAFTVFAIQWTAINKRTFRKG